jgi:hypothetical protein
MENDDGLRKKEANAQAEAPQEMSDAMARAAHPHSSPRAHEWGPPMPGSGSMRICRTCGAKEVSTAADPNHPAGQCRPPDMPVAHTVSEYEPL